MPWCYETWHRGVHIIARGANVATNSLTTEPSSSIHIAQCDVESLCRESEGNREDWLVRSSLGNASVSWGYREKKNTDFSYIVSSMVLIYVPDHFLIFFICVMSSSNSLDSIRFQQKWILQKQIPYCFSHSLYKVSESFSRVFSKNIIWCNQYKGAWSNFLNDSTIHYCSSV